VAEAAKRNWRTPQQYGLSCAGAASISTLTWSKMASAIWLAGGSGVDLNCRASRLLDGACGTWIAFCAPLTASCRSAAVQPLADDAGSSRHLRDVRSRARGVMRPLPGSSGLRRAAARRPWCALQKTEAARGLLLLVVNGGDGRRTAVLRARCGRRRRSLVGCCAADQPFRGGQAGRRCRHRPLARRVDGNTRGRRLARSRTTMRRATD
jgi:hypothetical protein